MPQQKPLLPANIDPAPQDLPAVSEGLGPTEVQRIGQFLNAGASEKPRARYGFAWKTFT